MVGPSGFMQAPKATCGTVKRHVLYKGKHYTLTYDSENVIDTVTLFGESNLLSTTNRNVSYLVRHAENIFMFKEVKNISYR